MAPAPPAFRLYRHRRISLRGLAGDLWGILYNPPHDYANTGFLAQRDGFSQNLGTMKTRITKEEPLVNKGGRPREAPPPCGTYRAYARHNRYGEDIDEACAQAARDQANGRTRMQSEVQEERLNEALDREPAVDPAKLAELEELLENLRIIRATMKVAPPNAIAGLSKRREEVTAKIVKLRDGDKKEKGSALDQLNARRAARAASGQSAAVS